MVFINLAKGLQRLGVPYRVNDFRHARRNPDELACIVGKPHVVFERDWANPILLGASVFSHPLDCPDLFERYPVVRVLVPGEWMRRMFEPYYGTRVEAWPVGIDTDEWRPSREPKSVDVLIYDKLRWNRPAADSSLLTPLRQALATRGRTTEVIRYGKYLPAQLKGALTRCRVAIFLCEHETQGLACQQMLSTGVPVLAWDPGGCWQDPSYYPERVQFCPVTSVPYWDERCGVRFESAAQIADAFDEFWEANLASAFAPREFVLDNLTLERCADRYMRIAQACGADGRAVSGIPRW